MRRSLLLFSLAVGCSLTLACGAEERGGKATGGAAIGENSAAPATGPVKSDVDFARDAVERLLNGDTTVEEAFAWETLKVPGAEDAGEAYSELPDEENRKEFRKGFIEKFSESFKGAGATVSDLKNWREHARDGETIVVAVDSKAEKPLLVTVVRRDGQQKVSELFIE